MVVYTTAEGKFSDVAERVASDRKEPLLTEIDEALETDGPIVWVDAPSNLTERTLLTLQQRLLDDGPEDGAFSLITGYTPEFAEELYFSRLETESRDVLAFPSYPPEEVPNPPDVTMLIDGEATADAIATSTETAPRSFQLSAAGRRIHIYLSEGLICGVPETQDIDAYPEPQPYCISDGQPDCPLSDDLVPAESIDAAHMFVMSCAPAIPNGEGGLPVHAATGLLNGTESFIGSHRVGASLPHELLLHHSLLVSGYDVTQRCYILNENSHVNGIMSYPYISFGRPSAGIDEPHDPQFDVTFEVDDQLHVELSNVDAYVVDVSLPAADVPATDDRLWVRNRSDTGEKIYYSVFEEGDSARLLVYTGDRMEFDSLDLVVSGHRAGHVRRRTAVASAENVTRTADLGFLTDEATAEVETLEQQLRTLDRETADERFDVDGHVDVEPRLNSIQGHVDAIRDEILDVINEQAGYLYRVYGEYVVDDDVYPADGLCTICHERPTFVKQVATWRGEAKRLFNSCGRCGHVFEVPATGRDPDPMYPLVGVDLDAAGERYQPLEIAFENPRDSPIRATFQPVLMHMDNESNSCFDPERESTVLMPGESHVAEFTVDTVLIPEDVYHISGIVVANLEIYAGHTTTVFGDVAGYTPPHLRRD